MQFLSVHDRHPTVPPYADTRPGSFLLQRFQVPVQMTLILGFYRGHVDHVPDVTFTVVITHQHAQQFADVQRIALGPTLSAIDFDRGGIPHMVAEPLCLQKAMQPEALSSRFVTTHHRRAVRQAKSCFGVGDFVEHALLITGRERPFTRFLTMTDAEAKLPGFLTQFKRHKQNALSGVIMPVVGRWGHHELSPPG
jgi:hypothetical protein